jgi:hypothetical protein
MCSKGDEACWQHSNFVHEVTQLKVHVDYLQAALEVVEEEVAEARAVATAAQVRAYGGASFIPGFCFLGSCS